MYNSEYIVNNILRMYKNGICRYNTCINVLKIMFLIIKIHNSIMLLCNFQNLINFLKTIIVCVYLMRG